MDIGFSMGLRPQDRRATLYIQAHPWLRSLCPMGLRPADALRQALRRNAK